MLNVSDVDALPCELLGDETVGLVVGAEAAVPLGDTEAEQSVHAQIRVVVEGKRGVPVVRVGARRKALERQPAGAGDQCLLVGRGPEIHARSMIPVS